MEEDEKPLTLKTTLVERDAYDRMAAEAGMSRHAWMKLILNSVAGVSAIQEQTRQASKAHRSVVKKNTVRDGKW